MVVDIVPGDWSEICSGDFISWCKNLGSISHSSNTNSWLGSKVDPGAYGGLAGKVSSTRIECSCNLGSIEGSGYVGGLVGSSSGESQVYESYNSGKVHCIVYSAGLNKTAGLRWISWCRDFGSNIGKILL